MRTEMPGNVVIMRLDKNLTWIIMLQQRMYMEQALKPKDLPKTSKELGGEIERVSLGMETVDGIEYTFALNHLAYFLLTNLLLDMLRRSAPSRIVSVSSGIHKTAELDFDDLGTKKGYSAFKAYGRSKLANVLFTYELARRLHESGVVATVMNPGFTSTGFGRNNKGFFGAMTRVSNAMGAKSAEKGARTLIWLASSEDVEGVTGKYFEIPSMGTLLLANHTPDLDTLGFQDNVNFVEINKYNWTDKIDYIVSNPEQYTDIRVRGYNFVVNNHTIYHRANQLMDIIDEATRRI